ncbi:hypothetical protein ACHAXT_011164 [Thalassiosira profunda]
MIQIQKLVAYAGMAVALAVLLSSTAKIGSAILTQNSAPVDGFDVHLDDNGGDLVDLDEEPLLPIHRRLQAAQKGESGPGAVRDVLPALAHMASRVRKLDESKLPYKCGAILYDQQIPGEGGDLLNEWIQKMVKNNGGSFLSSGEQESKDAFVKEAEKQLQQLGPKDWKIIYTHKNGLAFDADENILRSWRGIVEKRNCHFVAASVFADPLDHSIKHTKKQFSECQCSMEEFKGKILDAVGAGNPWVGQLNHFLFNSGEGSGMDMKDKVKRGVKLLKNNFDLVLVDGEKDFSEELLRITGWKARSQVKKANISDGELVYSKKLVSAVGKMSAANGDEHFIDAVMHIYHNSLGYLMTQ